ncbi:type II toxin-antitoxin system VapC family toxin [Microbacterium sp. p3-SID336]|uniref:type II toxin-antitoxin system VapC family toxin n=1 Tax=Microbacterium sp. p3-SID336 TaxID=2916212 RepID=UPI0021A5471D|nr:type II toxin-antitoxin system VapC family toxin [Microbacterium sp. p3-SID336]MCT1479733.1 type II toxin-antitoxin system VapC family toxin [Microbacterium sp. p3-SID336]
MTVLDASAVLAFLQGEPGADRVEELLDGAVVGAANWSEIAQKVRAAGADWGIASGLLLSYRLTIEPVSVADAEAAASLWRRGSGLSLGDRLCLGLAERLGATAVTADRAWGESDRIEQLRR